MKFELSDEVIRAIAYCKPYAVEKVLLFLRTRLEAFNNKEWTNTGYLKVNLDQKELPLLDHPEQEFQNQLQQNCDQSEADQSTYETFLYHRNKKTMKSQTIQKPFAIKNETNSISQLEEKQKESLAKDETIKILQEKIQRLEYLNHLKDLKINDLQKRLSEI